MAENQVLDVTAQTWDHEILESAVPVAVDFWHDGCSWCRRLEPVYQELARTYSGRVRFARLHVLREREVADRFGILGTPTIKFFCRGQEVYEIVGYRPLPALKEELETVLAVSQECLDSTTPFSRDTA
ncbi:MAG: thioredoxin family protein [Thermoplasmata archaeon]